MTGIDTSEVQVLLHGFQLIHMHLYTCWILAHDNNILSGLALCGASQKPKMISEPGGLWSVGLSNFVPYQSCYGRSWIYSGFIGLTMQVLSCDDTGVGCGWSCFQGARDNVRATRQELLYGLVQCDSNYCKIASAVLWPLLACLSLVKVNSISDVINVLGSSRSTRSTIWFIADLRAFIYLSVS